MASISLKNLKYKSLKRGGSEKTLSRVGELRPSE